MSRLARFLTVVTLALAAVLSATAAFAAEPAPLPAVGTFVAQDHGGDATAQGEGSTIDVVPPLLWAVAGVAGGAIVMAGLYLLKRRLGGFPANPDWVAPITIMESRTFPKEGDYGDMPAAEAHGAHH